ncbi:MMPL family transporter [Vibrio mangrovi]|uniref:MMPL family protein n=1 Tax=Vibrio mangrovi TaxID=474394 RepID=A0A1Y6IR66_9VIBR|nr:MMPL family transporter [Vibrio mangrovi]MDW6001855.1 MMPL family transporter [Vibrio mangrovi]SMS00118.1 MMPL family protein [Vibrio mangrovi]
MQKKLSSISKRFNAKSRTNWPAILWLVCVLLCSTFLIQRIFFTTAQPFETNILKLLPGNQQDPWVEKAFRQISERMSDRLIFILSQHDENRLYQAARQFESALSASHDFTQVTGKISDQQRQQWTQYYFRHRFQQLSPVQHERLSQHPEQQIQQVIQTLYNPFSGVTGQELSQDPFLLFREFLTQNQSLNSRFSLKNNYLIAQDGETQYLLITARLAQSPYSFSAQQTVAQINHWEQQIKQTYQVNTDHTGVLFYAESGTRSAKSEISTIGMFSLIGIVVLLLAVFRSMTPLLLALLSVFTGILVALTVVIITFGKIHLFSLVVGTSLLGISIDYAFHYLTHRLEMGAQWNSKQGIQHIRVAITLGLITSLISYIGLLMTPFPGLKQLALFSTTGLTAAYLTVVLWYPGLTKSPARNVALPGQALLSGWLSLWQKNGFRWGMPALILTGSLILLPHLRYDDDIRQLQTLPPELKQQETRIASLTGMQASQQSLIVSAENDEALMQRLETLDEQLAQWKKDHQIQGYQSLTQAIHSIQRQQEDFRLIRQLYRNFGPELAQKLKLSVPPSLPQKQFQAISLADFLRLEVSTPVRLLYLGKIEQQSAAVVLLKEVTSPEVIRSFARQTPQIRYLNKVQDISDLFNQYRLKVMELLAVAIVLITALLITRYGFRRTTLIILPTFIACLAGLSVSVIVGEPLNLFHLLALILILGIGIDYTLFFAEQKHAPGTLLAITLSAVTTLLSFGLLALSQTQAIHGFGLTLLCGIFVVWLLSPLATSSNPEH